MLVCAKWNTKLTCDHFKICIVSWSRPSPMHFSIRWKPISQTYPIKACLSLSLSVTHGLLYMVQNESYNQSRRKCIFSPYILAFFYFGPYIFILPLLIPKPINAWHLSPYHHPINRTSWRGGWHIKIIIKKSILACHISI